VASRARRSPQSQRPVQSSRSGQSAQSLRSGSVRTRREGNGFAHVQVAQIQRARILGAMFDVAVERGAASVSVADVVERSGVSRRTFYESFSDREDCFLAAFQDALMFAGERVLPAYESQGSWREKIRAALTALLVFVDEEPVIGRILIVESLSGGPRVLQRRGEILAAVTRAIDEGRGEPKAADATPLSAEGIVGGVLTVIHSRLIASPRTGETEHAPLAELVGALMSMIVLPYLGAVAAKRELDRVMPPAVKGERSSSVLADPFKEAGMRITYRTVRVLSAIDALGGRGVNPSNRQVGETAGIADQGQISKLLSRLERIGLISNTGLGPGQGAPNSWGLTPSGERVVSTIRAHTESPQAGGHEQ
jgi:AcrR family transcriptional regulator